MQNPNYLCAVALITLQLSVLTASCYATSLDYSSSTEATAEVGWHDQFGSYWDSDIDSNEANNAPAYASAYYDRIQYAGEIGASAWARVTTGPNTVTLSSKVSGSYIFDVGSDLLDYFLQNVTSQIEGTLQTTKFPPGSPYSLRIEVSFPQTTWTAAYLWQLYITSGVEEFACGHLPDGDYGTSSDTITAFAGEPVYVFLETSGLGYANREIGNHLAQGTLEITVTLTPTMHIADLSEDYFVNFKDFALLSVQWFNSDCTNPATMWCRKANIDRNGSVDANDMALLAFYWLLSPIPSLSP